MIINSYNENIYETTLLDIIKNMHTIVGNHFRRDVWKPSICYLNVTTSVPENMKAEEFLLEIGSGQFIPGFEEGMIGFKKGDKN